MQFNIHRTIYCTDVNISRHFPFSPVTFPISPSISTPLNPNCPINPMSSPSDGHFQKGAEVEISSNDDGFRGAWYVGTVIRPPNSRNKVLVEYKTLMADDAGTKPLRETVDVVQLRPPPPRELSRTFKLSEEVDAYFNDGWWEGVITDVLLQDRYSVFFWGTREQVDFGHLELRFHREWVNGLWMPPLEEQVPTSTIMKPSKGMVEDLFREGTHVEVSSDEGGFQGAWFAATVIKRLRNGNYCIEYESLRNDDDTEYLREVVDNLHIRPSPPVALVENRFEKLEEVDALYNDGWWVGIISKVLEGQKYTVYFRGTSEEIEFKHSDIRMHQDWIAGKWIIVSRVPTSTIMNPSKGMMEDLFKEGTCVEVSSDEEGFQGAWFAATVIKGLGNGKYCIEYESLRNDDDTEYLREEVDNLHIRPSPPEALVENRFENLEEVDALYNDGWWVGVISKVLEGQKYTVYFRGTSEEIEFNHSDIRMHQEWIAGKWIIVSRPF